jgi:hypothetical protein
VDERPCGTHRNFAAARELNLSSAHVEGFVPVMTVRRRPRPLAASLQCDALIARIVTGSKNGDLRSQDIERRLAISGLNDEWLWTQGSPQSGHTS